MQEWDGGQAVWRRPQTPYDHATQIRDLLGYREFSAAEGEVAAFIASRVAKTRDSRRELFDRAVLWLIENRVLVPGISTLSRLVAEVRRAELAAINSALVDAAPGLGSSPSSATTTQDPPAAACLRNGCTARGARAGTRGRHAHAWPGGSHPA